MERPRADHGDTCGGARGGHPKRRSAPDASRIKSLFMKLSTGCGGFKARSFCRDGPLAGAARPELVRDGQGRFKLRELVVRRCPVDEGDTDELRGCIQHGHRMMPDVGAIDDARRTGHAKRAQARDP